MSDLRLAMRLLWRDRNATVALTFSLAVGIGANVATFAVLDRILFQPPRGVVEPGTVRRFLMEGAISGQFDVINVFSYPTVGDFQAAVPSVSFAGYEPPVQRPYGENGKEAAVSYVTEEFFHLLGVGTAAGSVPGERESREVRDWVLLSYGFWSREFGGDRSVVGKTIRVDGRPAIVVGVAQRGFEGIDLEPVDVWAPLSSRLPASGDAWHDRRTIGQLRVVGRMGSNAQRPVEDQLTRSFLANSADALRLSPSTRIRSAPLLEALGPALHGQNRANLLLAEKLAVVALIVLLSSVTSAAGLLLMRMIQRRRVTAVRLALGSPFSRIVRYELVESLVLAIAVGSAGLLAGWWAGEILRSALVVDVRWTASPLIHRSTALALGLGVGCALLASLVPLLLAGRAQAQEVLRQQMTSADITGARVRRWLLAVQIATSVTLLSAGGVLIRGIRAQAQVDIGMDAERLVSIGASGRLLTAVDVHRATERIRSLEGIEKVALATWDIRPSRRNTNLAVRVEAAEADSLRHHPATLVDSNYFTVAGLRVVAGRGINGDDLRGTESVIVLSKSMADLYWPAGGAVGQCLTAAALDETAASLNSGGVECLRVVGVVQDIRWNPSEQEWPHAYLAVSQFEPREVCCHSLLVRAALPVNASLLREITGIIATELPSGIAPARVQSVVARLEPFNRPLRVAAGLLLVCGVLVLVSMCMGLYGVVAYEVRQRTQELAVRITLGATRLSLLRLVASSTLQAVMVGIVTGIIAARIGLPHLLTAMPRGSATDYLSMAIVAVTVTLTAILACIAGVRRLWTLNTAAALRFE